ncbi:NADP oxidoreductase [Geothrix rubra]|uniref:NADP oxidoreductase n=1 Tax=Geothrix rubra TaxID=2927977 RepID=A0ABQ5Q844_9BACT|nr:Ni/Fe hydrogenase subunit alpha [Geothrix rubra]GLH70974.1 NADP oxidoreductase [Geothrix rubra]
MSPTLETAAQPADLKRVVIEPVTRVEGHGKVTILLDEENRIHQVRLHIVEFRGFEKFIQGRPYWEVPVMVQRLCGICPVSHHLAAGKAVDMLVGARKLTPAAEKLRRLLHVGQMLQSHALHFFHLASPDLLFGFDSDVAKRNVIGVIEAHPDLAVQGVKLRKYGQEVIRHIAGKRVHGVAAIPGGMNKALKVEERDLLLRDIGPVVEWSRAAVALSRKVFEASAEQHREFGVFPSNFMSLTGPAGELEFYDGGLRARDAQGSAIFDHVDYAHYNRFIREEVKPWSYMKFPFIISQGAEGGWYRVGPLARVNNCDSITTPLAEAERRTFREAAGGGMQHASLAYHWARMIEMLHAAEEIERLLNDPEILGTDLVTKGERALEGIGVIEAPRGTLFHHYRINESDVIEKANLIVSTTNNNQAMNEAVRQVAARYLDGKTLTEGLLNHIEVAIRAYDPCLSCATHALGRMPLQVELLDAEGRLLDRLVKDADGGLSCGEA